MDTTKFHAKDIKRKLLGTILITPQMMMVIP